LNLTLRAYRFRSPGSISQPSRELLSWSLSSCYQLSINYSPGSISQPWIKPASVKRV